MTTLLIAAQDIKWIELGVVEDGELVHEAKVDALPEAYLAAVDATLSKWKLSPKDFKAIAVVVGPGAFTASRVGTVIANTLAFAEQIPIIPIENPKRLPLADLASALPTIRTTHAVPVYDRGANITLKK